MKIGAAPPVLLVCGVLLLPACASGGGGAPASSGGAAADSTRVYDISEVQTKPQVVNRSAVVRALEQNYRGDLRDEGARGTVFVRMVLETTGETSMVTVVGSTNPAFNTSASNVARAMRFSPARVNGVPVRVRIELPITFQRSESP
jgi:TonB family protein